MQSIGQFTPFQTATVEQEQKKFIIARPPENSSSACCLVRIVHQIAERIAIIVRWIICKIANCFGVVVHGNSDASDLENHFSRFDIRKLIASGPYESPALSLEAQKLIQDSFAGLNRVVDTHLHILGYDEGNFLNPNLDSCCSGIKFSIIHCAATGSSRKEGSTQLAARRLQIYADNFPKFHGMILPIHPTVSPDGTTDWEQTGSYLKNSIAARAARSFSSKDSKLFPTISLHPNDLAWEKRLCKAHEKGIRLIKWFPSQGINASDNRLDLFYERVQKLGMTIIAHSGPEHTIPCPKEWEDFGNPKLFEKPLKAGVNVILAHSGHQENWQDFIALAEKAHAEKWPGKLYGDLGGMLHYGAEFAKNLILNSRKSGVRIIYGSDYPYTNLVSPSNDPIKVLANADLIDSDKVKPLKEIREWNPLLGNFITVRHLRVNFENREVSFPYATFTGEFDDGEPELFNASN